MSILAVPIIAVLALVMSFICLILLLIKSAQHKVKISVVESQLQANELLIANLQSAHEQLKQEIRSAIEAYDKTSLEDIQVSKQLEHRIKSVQSHLTEQQAAIEQIQSSQGEDKFYSRAIKLAKKGAKLDEIVDECELPHAEVEMLLSVYQNNSNT